MWETALDGPIGQPQPTLSHLNCSVLKAHDAELHTSSSERPHAHTDILKSY